MRWLVEVTSPGTEKQSLHVDAETWQAALEAARLQRGETQMLGGFAFDVQAEGCRAVDPASLVRYDVTAATGSDTTDGPPPATSALERVATIPGAAGAGDEGPGLKAGSKPVPRPSSHAPSVRRSAFPQRTSPEATSRTSEAAHRFEILFKREQQRTDAAPLTYREYIFAVAPGTSEKTAEDFLRGQLRRVQGVIEAIPAGKIVNLAAVDAHVDGKPTGRPLATLSWKDWRGSVVVEFPRRRSASRPPSRFFSEPPTRPSMPPPSELPRLVSGPPKANGSDPPGRLTALESASAILPPAPAPVVDGQQATQTDVMDAPASATTDAPTTDAPTNQPGADQPAAPAMSPPPRVVNPDPFAVPPSAVASPDPFAIPAPPPSRRSTSSPRNRAVRVRAEDLVADLFEAMHEMHFLRDAVEAGDFCLSLAMQEIPSRAGLVHLYDINRRQFLITNAVGSGTAAMLSRRHPETERVLSAAMRRRRPLLIEDVEEAATTCERYNELGGAKSVIVAPVMQSGRFLGAIELLNPLDDQPYTPAERDAVMYIAEQLAEFVAARGVVTDPERIVAPR